MTTLESKFMTRIVNVAGTPFTIKMGVVTPDDQAHTLFDQTLSNIRHFLRHVNKITTPALNAGNPIETRQALTKQELVPLQHQFMFVDNATPATLMTDGITYTMIQQWAMQQAYRKYLAPLLSHKHVFAVAIESSGNVQVGTAADTAFTWTLGVTSRRHQQTMLAVYSLRNGALATQRFDRANQKITQATIVSRDLAEAGAWAAIAAATSESEFLRIAVIQRLSGLLISSEQESQSLERGIVLQHQLVAV
ncbi:hypothetical protein [Furfurilactobacillus milii]|uniref:hypothetical protein n=1 Tax=Furfurilactobacillus milii TaxID=2888272 RepID=UPI001F21A2C3|nr:hypothetical protein [Furfurilactobacillus milii]MCF6418513.1 hypothetical protein [Furfurilactobacillus milii]